jgi:hypothetical protein
MHNNRQYRRPSGRRVTKLYWTLFSRGAWVREWKEKEDHIMTSEQCDVLKDIFRNVVAVGKRQQLQLAAYIAVFNIFKKMYPQYTEELDANLEAASNATVPQDKSFAQFELATEKFLSTPFDSLSVSDLSQIHEIIKQKFSN